MKAKFIRFFTTLFLISMFGEMSCTPDLPECPNKMCLLSGGWILTTVIIDGIQDNTDLTQYRLNLVAPETNATASTFSRTLTDGTEDNGSWSTENNDQVLRLIPSNDPLLTEDYFIESFTLRSLILVINRDSNKTGPSQIRFVLEPY